MSKACRKCEEVKPLDAYYKHLQMADGRLNICKDCTKARVSRHRESNIDQIRAYDRARPNHKQRAEAFKDYSKTERGKRSAARARAAYKERNPIKLAATSALNNAIRDGKAVKLNGCECCGSAKRIQAHHSCYDLPLAVTWLCEPCHKRLHKEFNELQRITGS